MSGREQNCSVRCASFNAVLPFGYDNGSRYNLPRPICEEDSPGPDYTVYVFVLFLSVLVIICQLYKLTLADKAQSPSTTDGQGRTYLCLFSTSCIKIFSRKAVPRRGRKKFLPGSEPVPGGGPDGEADSRQRLRIKGNDGVQTKVKDVVCGLRCVCFVIRIYRDSSDYIFTDLFILK
jgi:hypothetical protein